jgi:thiol-disulfide isomerase/thioredoxin
MRALLVTVLLAAYAVSAACGAPVSVAGPPQTPPAPLAALEASVDLDGRGIGSSAAAATVVITLASWCGHCRAALQVLDAVRARHPSVRWLAVSYREHETFDGRGDAAALRALAAEVPWLRVISADDALFAALGRPPLVPTTFVFDRAHRLVAHYDRRDRRPPSEAELDALLRSLP